MAWRETVVRRARAHEFRVPTKGRRSAAFNTVLRLDAVSGNASLHGVGEASPRGEGITGDSFTVSWEFLGRALARLDGFKVHGGLDAARADLRDLMNELRMLAHATPGADGPAVRCGGTLAGIEMALVDLAAKAGRIPMAEFLGRQRRRVTVMSPPIGARRSDDSVRAKARAYARFPTLKIADAHAAGDVLRAALAAASVAKRAALWLELPDQLSAVEVTVLLRLLGGKIHSGELPPHIVVRQSAGEANPSELAELQATADDIVTPERRRPGLVVMATARSPAHAHVLVNAGVRGVELNPSRLGGALAVRDVALEMHESSPNTRVCLTGVGQVSGISGRALVEVGLALPRLDYCALAPRSLGGPMAIEPPVAHDKAGRIRPGRGVGLRGAAVLAPAVKYVSRFAEAPVMSTPPLTYGELPANSYDIDAMSIFDTPGGGVAIVSNLLERAALVRGLSTTRVSSSVFTAEHADMAEPIGFANSKSGWTGTGARRVADDKDLTREVLRRSGVAVPRGAAFAPGQVEEAVRYAASLGVPVVVKPQGGRQGKGVSTDLRSEPDVRTAIATLGTTAYASKPFVVEEHVIGNDYRFFVVGDRVVSVVLKRPASVVGDGRSTIVDLVLQKNRKRLENPHMRGRMMALDADARFWLRRQGLTFDSVPEQGRTVRLGSAGNVASGGDSVEVLDETHPSLVSLAVHAVHSVPGLDHSGIDIIGDHRQSTDDHPAAVIEVNASPGTGLNHFPLFGTPRDVSSELVMRSCDLVGFDPDEPRDHLTVRIQIDGYVQGVGYRQWFATLARGRGLAGSVRNMPSGVEAIVSGRADDVWLLVSRAISGPSAAVVSRVTTTHVTDVTPTDRFEVA